MAHDEIEIVARQLEKLVEDQKAVALTDGQLLARFSERREPDAFEALVRRHGRLVLGVSKRVLHNAHDAEDVFQAAFLVLAQKAGSLDRRRSVGNWLYAVAYHLALRAKSGVERRRACEREASSASSVDPLSEVSGRELYSLLDAELQRLPMKYRAPLVLCYLEGNTRDEAAQLLGWSLGAVKGRLERGRNILRGRLVRRGLTLSAALLGGVIADNASAAVTGTLQSTTVASAILFASPHTLATGGISTRVLALAKGGLQSMFVTKLKIAASALLAMTVFAAVSGVVAHQLLAAKPPRETSQDSPKPMNQGPNPKEEKPRVDAFGDPLPPGVIARMGTVRFKTPSRPVTAAAFSPDGKIVAVGGWNKGVCLTDTETGKRLRNLEGDSWPPVLSLAFSPDGKHLAALVAEGGPGNSTLNFDVETGKKLNQFDSGTVNTRSIAFAGDGKTLVAVKSSYNTPDEAPVLFEVATGKVLHELKGHRATVDSVEFSPDGTRIISKDGNEMIRIWDTSTGKELDRMDLAGVGKRLGAACKLIAASHDGKTLGLRHDGATLVLWDPHAEKELGRLPSVPLYEIPVLTFTPDGKTLATVSNSYTIRLWDASTGKETGPFGGRSCTFDCLALSPDGRALASSGPSGPVCLWDTATGKERYRLEDPGTVRSLAFSPGGSILAIGLESGIQLLDVTGMEGQDNITVKKRDPFHGDRGRTEAINGEALAFSPDGKMLAGAGYSTQYELWDVASGKSIRRVQRKKEWIHALVFSTDGKHLATMSEGGSKGWSESLVSLWNVETGEEYKGPFRGLHGIFTTDDFRAEGEPLRESPGLRDNFNITTPMILGEQFRSMIRNPAGVSRAKIVGNHGRRVSVSPDGRIAAHLNGNEVQLYDLLTGKCFRSLTSGHLGRVTTVAFSLDGRTLVTGGDDQIALVWDLTGMSPDGKMPSAELTPKQLEEFWTLLGRDDARYAVWALASGSERTTKFLGEHLQPVSPGDEKKVGQWIRDLDDEHFDVRENASKELGRLDWGAEPALQKALKNPPSEEARRRIEELLKNLEPTALTGERLQKERAIEVLERIDSTASREVLAKLAKGVAEAPLTQNAQAALERHAGREANRR
jgi:RNA polymerase sigma factor (sigma-70 family)